MGMYTLHDLRYKIRAYFKPSKEEIKALAITIVALSFIVGFNDRRAEFVGSFWIMNFLIVLGMVAVTVLLHNFVQRVVALQSGLRIEYNLWWIGIVIGLILSVISKGRIWWVLIPGGIVLHHLAAHRLGYFRYGTNIMTMSWITFSGTFANILFATFLKTLDVWFKVPFQGTILERLFVLNWVFAVCNMIPIPPLDGSKMLFHSRPIFAFVFGCIFGYFVLFLFGIYSYVGALIIGIVIWLVYYASFEQRYWKGGW